MFNVTRMSWLAFAAVITSYLHAVSRQLSKYCKWTYTRNLGLICHYQKIGRCVCNVHPVIESGRNGQIVRIILDII